MAVRHVVDGYDAFVRRDVSEPRRRDDVADRVDAGLAGLEDFVDLDVAAVELHARGVEAQAVADRFASHGDEQHLGLELAGPAVVRHAVGRDARRRHLDVLELRPSSHLDALFLEGLFERFADLFVLDRQEAGEELDDRDVDAESMEDRRKLDADGAGAEHDHRLRQLLELEDLVGGEDPLAVGLEAREHAGHRARGDDEVLELDRLGVAVVALDRELALAVEPAEAVEDGDLVLAHQELDALGVRGDDLVLARGDLGVVDRGLFDDDPELVGVLDLVVDVGRMEQRFGGDAAPQQARTAEPRVLLDDGDLHADVRGVDGCRVPTWARPQNCKIKAIGFRHANVLRFGSK
jgi:hypothetical protein